ncbi:methyltransferase domain-containing protein [Streptomyces sp. Qhu-G9]|uniref:SAM-dependent methyltransferase n=1 Tax=Streptomyces sp. Qhu-G9 TaxID=3452799 RepID=UPI0022ABED95|nr:methyltransferase domain-containing protein [Streptomyces aurantiacus]WAU82671.1 methyltransferase domain-containing protein [Streptomyces aurantiacus]
MEQALDTPTVRTSYERDLHRHWSDKTNDPINLRLGAEDGLYHHHYGVGGFDPSVLQAPLDVREKLILAEMHRMENDQVSLILDALGEVPADARIMDAGSGRGGTSFLLHRRFGCLMDGVNFCGHHLDFSRQLGVRHGYQDRVQFTEANMVATPFADQTFDYVVSNETTMYVDLDEAFGEFARLLKPAGRYVLVTWCRDDTATDVHPDADAIDRHYVCHIHRRSAYLRALLNAGLVPKQVTDLTTEAIPYWELRSASELATGVEPHFLDAYRQGQMNYIVITADRISEAASENVAVRADG